VTPDTVYVGQQVTYDAITLVDEAARSRLRTNPQYTPPPVSGATLYDFRFDTTLISDVSVNGYPYRQYIYRRAIYPLTVGTYDIPAATLQYSLPDEDGYFSQHIAYTLHSESLQFVVVPLPITGKPVDFNGVVGQFTDTAYTDGSPPHVGEPFLLTLRVSGIGNITLLPRPSLNIDWADAVDSKERVSWDSTGSVVRGYKEFEWVVTPKVAGRMFIPRIRYDYFDPTSRSYKSAATREIRMTVAASGATATLPNGVTTPDTIGTTPFPMIANMLREHWRIAAGVAIALIVLILVFAVRAIGADSDEE
jgi:hypothetical protein